LINSKRILAVVPARGGSKGIKLKNLASIAGRPLVALVGDVVKKIPIIDRAVVSTDHVEIARVAEGAGLSAPFLRPKELSGDFIGDVDVLTHALLAIESLDLIKYDVILMLQPTSPLREAKHVIDCIQMLIDGEWDAVWTVSETDSKSHPYKQLTVSPDGVLDYWDPRGAQVIARQQLSPVFHRNGIAYAIKRECLLNQCTIKGIRTGALVINGDHVSIDTEHDLEIIKNILKKNNIKN
jgi:CMP-N,N'-diacetyllegionaminic acid synthase